VGTSTADMASPSAGCMIQHKLGAKKAVAFDVNAACPGFIYGLAVARKFMQDGSHRYALVIGGEIISHRTDFQDRNTCVLFGDGAGAVVLGLAAREKDGELLSTEIYSDGDLWKLLHVPGGGSMNPISHEMIDQRLHYVKMKGNEVFKHAVRSMTEAAQKALEGAGLTKNQVDWFIPIRPISGSWSPWPSKWTSRWKKSSKPSINTAIPRRPPSPRPWTKRCVPVRSSGGRSSCVLLSVPGSPGGRPSSGFDPRQSDPPAIQSPILFRLAFFRTPFVFPWFVLSLGRRFPGRLGPRERAFPAFRGCGRFPARFFSGHQVGGRRFRFSPRGGALDLPGSFPGTSRRAGGSFFISGISRRTMPGAGRSRSS